MVDIEEEIYEIWKELRPSDAFLEGLNQYAGKLFIFSSENKERVQKKIQYLKSKANTQVEKKFLISLEATLKFRDPHHDLSDMTWTLFGHLMKEGVNPLHISSLIDCMNQNIDYSINNHNLDALPIELKIILLNYCNALLGMLKSISKDTDDTALKEKIERGLSKIKEYKDLVPVKGLEKGDFTEVFPILKRDSTGDLGRFTLYPQLIKEQYDYYETPDEIEKKGLEWLEKELPRLMETAKIIADYYEIECNIEAVDKQIAQKRNVENTDLVNFIKDFRKKTSAVVEKHLVKINPRYDTRIIETPKSLLNFIPTAAMTSFDGLTEKPFNVLFVTTDEKHSPPTSPIDIFQLIVHEEYGHCVNFSNSALGFAIKPNLIEKLDSSLHFPISEAISFHRELETQTLVEELADKKREDLEKEEAELLDTMASWGDIKEIVLESRFLIYKWRIIRFLRAIGDVRINMNKQSVVEFVQWASKKTGFSEKLIYDQIFFFQENPGIAPCYAIAGMSLKEIQDEAKKKGKDILEFNTIASSLGFPGRTIFEEKLRNL
ncbi:MAG: hypothetical protein JSW00_15570 [Thermoplasmata archaeon]|nr:MAG: hypothetical protein JSW00_15570 [Thermoplasmata archaeon]